jgi:adenylyltransferase/sulfurtransferase
LKINQNNEDDCEHLGVLGPIAGVLGSIQATEVIKQILDEKENLLGQLLIFDGLSYRMKLIKINWDQNNPLNGKS